ncbi:MvdC/MvdD family ATP grasp protein [Pseudonocardia acaciae]|uniref:MvdC/MvdD family ATP grasp protein n=1 Tax=Pseudonocardia acaciae TaxID=551276 RepID=UPI003CCBD722
MLAGEMDRTADSVILALADLRVPVVRVDLSWFPQRMSLDAEFDSGRWHGSLRTEHHQVELDDVRSVWVRTPATFEMPTGLSSAEAAFAKREAKLGFGGVLMSLPDVLWVNRPDLAATAVYRPLQWMAASRYGLRVPRTWVGNDPKAVARFAGTAPSGVVLKPLSANLIWEDGTYKVGWTRRLISEDLADLRGIDVTCHLIQDWAPKSYECRVVFVGAEVFAFAIHAGSPESYVDWRSDYQALRCEPIELPERVTAGLRGVMADLGLVYGAFDLVVDPDGETIWFLEINPGGQYGFLEAATGEPISDSLARLLARESHR